MTHTQVQTMLRALGYASSKTGIAEFQRDYNRVGTQPLMVTGKLDEDTLEALGLAHSSAAMFRSVRDQGMR